MTRRLSFSAAAAYRRLRHADPVVAALIAQHGPYRPRPADDPYASLVRTIFYQQLTGAAAAAIMRRFCALHGDAERTPTAEEILATPDPDFRAAGISRQKMGYLRDLAQHVADGRLDFRAIARLPDAEVVPQLCAVRGIGEWSAHMFLMFQLDRPDILPVGDLGVRKGMQVAYRLAEAPGPDRAREIGAAWAPYRSVGSWYMWRAASTVTLDAEANRSRP